MPLLTVVQTTSDITAGFRDVTAEAESDYRDCIVLRYRAGWDGKPTEGIRMDGWPISKIIIAKENIVRMFSFHIDSERLLVEEQADDS